MRSSALFLAAHKHKLARPARCRVVCCVFGFLGPPRALFCSISQHTGQVLRLPLGHPAGTVLRFLVFRPGLGSVSPNIAAHRRGSWLYACRRSPVGTSPSPPHLLPVSHSLSARRHRRSVCCVFWFFSRLCALFHPISQHTGQVLRLPLGHPVGTVLRFRGIRSAIGLKKPDIAAHTKKGRRVDGGTGARRGCGRQGSGCVEARGSAWKRHIGPGRGAAGMLYGVRASRRKSALTREYR